MKSIEKKTMKKILLSALTAVAIIATGCSKEAAVTPGNPTGEGAITISIQSESPSARATGSPTTDAEKTVKSFTVYVFNNSTGVLEKSQTFTENLKGQVDGLSIGSQKKVAVLVNQPDGFPAVTSHSGLSEAMIGLDSQVPGDFSSTGLFMSGEHATPVTLSKDETVGITVQVKRITAKVKLGSLTVVPESGLSLDDFTLTGVSIQKARDKAPVFGGIPTTGFNYIGGIDGSGAVTVPYLHEHYSLPENYVGGTRLEPEVHFYVFPNDNTDNESTLMTLYGEYNGGKVFYPFYINDKIGAGENASDGTWIQRNKVYTLNVTLKKLGTGSENPNVPNEQVSMDVTVEIADWEGDLNQDVEW